MIAILLSGGPAATSAEPTLLVSADASGPQLPPVGRSLFDELFGSAAGYEVPYPFERLLDTLNTRLEPAAATTALIPLGRSLQRYEAAPDFFQSPRVIVAADSDGVHALSDPLLRDRLYLGYQPAAKAIEVISYNEDGGRFEFQRVTTYGEGLTPEISYAERDVCTGCHQGHGPIFSRPLWSETNANPAIAERLSALGARYHGAPVSQGIDGPDRFDRSTDRANMIAAVNRLWDEGCGDGDEGAACRAALLRAALEFRLGGARTEWRVTRSAESARLQQRLSNLWPDGLGNPSPDLPNRNPLATFTDAAQSRSLDVKGAADPLTPRSIFLQWNAAGDAASTFEALAREVAGSFAAADIVWLDNRLGQSAAEAGESHRADCRLESAAREQGRRELRFRCGETGRLGVQGFIVLNGSHVEGGRIDDLSIDGVSHARLLALDGAPGVQNGGEETFRIIPREGGTGLSARLPNLNRITALTLEIAEDAQGSMEISTASDQAALDDAIGEILAADAPALGPGPLRRRALLADLQRALAVH